MLIGTRITLKMRDQRSRLYEIRSMARISTRQLAGICRRLGTALEAGLDTRDAWKRESERGSPAQKAQLERVALRVANGDRVADYHRLDVRAMRSWPFRGGKMGVFVEILNLYNRTNPRGFGIDFRVRGDQVEVLRQPETWLGRFPTVGMSVDF